MAPKKREVNSPKPPATGDRKDTAALDAVSEKGSRKQSGDPSAIEPVVPFVAMMSAFEDLFEKAAERLSGELGPVTSMCDVFPFDFTDYYNAEMGNALQRTYVTFGRRVTEDELRRLKSLTSECEREFFYEGTERRRINLDAGLLTRDHLILASHKKVAHRIYLGDGVYAELEMIYINGAYQPLPWTYPDYRTRAASTFLQKARAALLRGARPSGTRVQEP